MPMTRANIQRGIKKLRFHLNRVQVPTSRDDLALLRLRNCHPGRRCFIIGNGPSLRMADLDLLAERQEISLASNNIFLAFEKTQWRPTYYGLEDTDLSRKYRDEINPHIKCPIIAANYLADVIGRGNNRTFFRQLPRVAPEKKPSFSWNLIKGIQCGGTITYTLLQIAAWMGMARVYLLGVDFSYNLGKTTPSNEFAGFNTYTYQPGIQQNYFASNYLKPGEKIVAPDLESSLRAYQSARAYCEKKKQMEIFNATRGGRLEVFERVDFDLLF